MFTINSSKVQIISSAENNISNSLSVAIQNYKDTTGNDNGIIKEILIKALQNDNEKAQHIIKELDLRITDSVHKVYFSGRKLHKYDIELIAEILKKNNTLLSLNLDCNEIGDEEAKAIAEALEQNNTLTSVNLGDNNIGINGLKALAASLTHNTTLTSLNVWGNDIDAEGAKVLAGALKKNNTLKSLDLRDSNIDLKGAIALADALKDNKTLVSLNLCNNKIDLKGAIALADALKDNKTLVSLNLCNNKIGLEGIKAIAEVLKTNDILLELRLDYTDDTSTYKNTIEEALQRNIIKHLNTYLKHNGLERDLDEDVASIINRSKHSQFEKAVENITKLKKVLNDIASLTVSFNQDLQTQLLKDINFIRYLEESHKDQKFITIEVNSLDNEKELSKVLSEKIVKQLKSYDEADPQYQEDTPSDAAKEPGYIIESLGRESMEAIIRELINSDQALLDTAIEHGDIKIEW